MKSILSAAIKKPTYVEVSLEDRYLNEIDEQFELSMAMESVEGQMLRLEDIEDTLDELESLHGSLESLISTQQYGGVSAEMIQERYLSLEQRADVEYDAPSFEGVSEGGLVEAELTLEAVTGIWNRLKQAYVNAWHGFMDGFATLIKGIDKFSSKHVLLAEKLRKAWAVKKGKISGKPIKASLVGPTTGAAYFLNNQIVKSPTQALKTDIGHAKYILEDYLPTMVKYLTKVEQIVERGDYSSDAAFEKTVLTDVSRLAHPRDVFKLSIVDKGLLLLGNRGLETKPGKPVKSVASGNAYKALSELLVKRHVRQKEGMTIKVSHDIYFDPREIDSMLSYYADMAGLLEDTNAQLSLALKAAKNITQINVDKLGGERLSGTNKKALKQIGKFIRQMPLYLNRPMKREINRVSMVVSGTRTLLSRTIATAK